jgi:hypothetical protein
MGVGRLSLARQDQAEAFGCNGCNCYYFAFPLLRFLLFFIKFPDFFC